MTTSRRAFLKQVSAAAALGLAGPVPLSFLRNTRPAALVREPDEDLLRELALVAVDAARAAGARFADVRMVAGSSVVFSFTADYRQGGSLAMGWPDSASRVAYGIRAIVDGSWGFAGGTELTADAVHRASEQAVALARNNRLRQAGTLELAPVPRGRTGTWRTPIEEDPFQVPVGEQADVAVAALDEAGRVAGIHSGFVTLRWNRNVRVFASSDDSLFVQRLAVAAPVAGILVNRTADLAYTNEPIEALRGGAGGYEILTRIDLNEEMRRAAERAAAEARLPEPPRVDVGRFDLVFAAPSIAALLARTVAAALNLERALGYLANTEGTSFAAPPADVLGQYRVGAPLLSVSADRTRPGGAATVAWDDEGVQPTHRTLVQDGIIVDYLTNRQTAAELADWYGSRGDAVRSGGCASGAGFVVPTVRLPNLTFEPGGEDLSVEDLIADTRRGYYIETGGGASDQQVLNTQGWASRRNLREIRDGKLGGRVRDLSFQFITPAFWQRLDGIGGPGSAVDSLQGTGYPIIDPVQIPYATVRAVPARVRDVNVLSFGRAS